MRCTRQQQLRNPSALHRHYSCTPTHQRTSRAHKQHCQAVPAAAAASLALAFLPWSGCSQGGLYATGKPGSNCKCCCKAGLLLLLAAPTSKLLMFCWCISSAADCDRCRGHTRHRLPSDLPTSSSCRGALSSTATATATAATAAASTHPTSG
jgi:hypothetical protein